MVDNIEANLQAHFGNIADPGQTDLNDHPLINIITIALCAVIVGAEGWTDTEMFGQQKKEWLSRFLDLENGIPSHDTFGRVFARINPEQFGRVSCPGCKPYSRSLAVRLSRSTAKSNAVPMTRGWASAPFG